MKEIQALSFPINNWSHLYSLQQAISHNNQLTGRKLSINGRILNQSFLQNQDTKVSINFLQVNETPEYPQVEPPGHDSFTNILGSMQFTEQHLTTEIAIDRGVFEELRKNLMEYADIEGIHIMITLGVLADSDCWKNNQSLSIVQLDYAMKGDA